jgi:UDPglucose 6-dehydrogenase
MIGTGYVGLVSGACFSEFGVTVACVDRDEKRVEELHRGQMPIYEPGLEELVLKNVENRRLSFTMDTASAVGGADIVFIAVGTPTRRGDGYADLSYVYEAAKETAKNLKGYTVIVNKSTVPVGTARNVQKVIRSTNPEADFDVASNPEFLREGSAINDFMRPDRVVIGVEEQRAETLMRELYRPLYLIETPMVITNLETAELIKYASNAFLAAKISYINEMSQLCESIGANIKDVAKGMGLDGRIGPKFLHAGPGYGGSCLPKDTKALIKIFQDQNLATRIVEAVVQVNDAQKSLVVKKIRDALGGSEYGKKVAVFGLTFKPQTDDVREAPSLTIIPALQEGGAIIKATDPKGMEEAKNHLSDIEYFNDPYMAAQDADAIVLMTEWNEFRALDFKKLSSKMNGKIFIDLKDVYEPAVVRAHGFSYFGVGVP